MLKTVLTTAALAACTTAALAQPATATTRAAMDPLDARAAVPAARALAPLQDYRRHTGVEVQPGAWRAANDNVNRIGGWRTYAREAQVTGSAADTPVASPGKPAPATAVPAPTVAPAAAPAPAPTPAPAHRH